MENQVNTSVQNTQQGSQNSVNQAMPMQEKQKVNYWIISTAIFAILFFVAVGVYLLTLKKVEKSQNFPPPMGQTTNIIPTATPTVLVEEQNSFKEGKIYTNNQLKISFDYPDSCEVNPEVSISPNEPVYHQVLSMHCLRDPLEKYYSRIVLSYYENPDNLSVPDFNNKYFQEPTQSGDPIAIWRPSYQKVTNINNGIEAYYDKDHYCVALCQTYVWEHNYKVFILTHFPVQGDTVSGGDIFHKVFKSLKFFD